MRFAVASSHRSAAKYNSVDDNDSSSEPIYQGIVEMDIGAIRKVRALNHLCRNSFHSHFLNEIISCL